MLTSAYCTLRFRQYLKAPNARPISYLAAALQFSGSCAGLHSQPPAKQFSASYKDATKTYQDGGRGVDELFRAVEGFDVGSGAVSITLFRPDCKTT